MDKKEVEQTQAEKDLSKKVNMFGKLPDKCLVCNSAFDKKSKKMVKEWRVVVKEDPVAVKLYCPKCWENANSLLEYVNKQQTKNVPDQDKEGYGTWRHNLEKKREK